MIQRLFAAGMSLHATFSRLDDPDVADRGKSVAATSRRQVRTFARDLLDLASLEYVG